MVDIKIKSNYAKLTEDFDKTKERVLYAIGVTAQGNVVDYMGQIDDTGRDIVDTGRLRASISFVTPETASGVNSAEAGTGDALKPNIKETNTVIIGTSVEYADIVNNGGATTNGRKFMENALEPNFKVYQDLADDIFKGKR